MNIPQPEVSHLDGEFGRLCWAMACAAMDETAGDFDLPDERTSYPLIATIPQAPLEIQAKPMAALVHLVLHGG